MYDRHAAALFDFLSRLLGDPAAGATAVHATFLRAWNSPSRDSACRVPLFATAYAVAAETHRTRTRTTAGTGRGGRADAAPSPSAIAALSALELRLVPGDADPADQQELARLVWVWASRLRRRDYALIDLHLRHGFEPADSARALGLRPSGVTSRLANLAAQAQEALAPAVLARQDPIDCPALEVALFSLPENTPIAAVSRVVRTHLGRCVLCQETRRQLPSPMALLAILAPVPLDQHRREELWAGISVGAGTKAAKPRARPAHHRHRPDVPRPLALAGIALGVVAVLVGAALTRSDSPAPAADVGDPVDIASASHVVGSSSPRSRVSVTWSPVAGAEGYSVRWSQGAADMPDRATDLSGSATQSTSPVLTPGRWWFHLRTLSPSGRWTDAEHLGPFLITAPPTTTALPGTTTTTIPPAVTTRPAPTTTVPPVTVPTQPVTTTTLSPLPTTTVPPTTTTLPPVTTTSTTLAPTTTTSTTIPPTTTTTVPPTTTTTEAPPTTVVPPAP